MGTTAIFKTWFNSTDKIKGDRNDICAICMNMFLLNFLSLHQRGEPLNVFYRNYATVSKETYDKEEKTNYGSDHETGNLADGSSLSKTLMHRCSFPNV